MSVPTAFSTVGCIVLAAGDSKRFGSDKRQALMQDGHTLLDLTLSLIPATFSLRILVLHPADVALAAYYQHAWQIIFAEHSNLGMGHSLAAAMPFVDQWTGAVVALADMPCVLPATYSLIQHRVQEDRIVVPHYQNQRGNPVGFGSRFFPAVGALLGDSGVRQLMQEHQHAVDKIEVDDEGILQDIDTTAALQALTLTTESKKLN